MCCTILITKYIRRKPLGEVKGNVGIFSGSSVTLSPGKNFNSNFNTMIRNANMERHGYFESIESAIHRHISTYHGLQLLGLSK